MDGGRESDRLIVPRKPASKGRSEGPAEEVEGRERAKGNAVEPPGAGHRAGKPCHMRSTAYGRHLRVSVRDHPRQEPGAVVPHAGIGVGGAG